MILEHMAFWNNKTIKTTTDHDKTSLTMNMAHGNTNSKLLYPAIMKLKQNSCNNSPTTKHFLFQT